MAPFPTPRDLARLAVQKAKDHLAAAKLLSAAKHHDFAMFHLLTATEEVIKSRLVGENVAQMLLTFEGRPGLNMERELGRSLFSHPFKIPAGLLTVIMQSAILNITNHPNFATGMRPEEYEEVKAKTLADAEWIAKNLSEGSELRQRAIYSGLDHSGNLPSPFDWRAPVERFTPILELQIEFSEWAVEQTMAPDDVKVARAQLEKRLKKLKADS